MLTVNLSNDTFNDNNHSESIAKKYMSPIGTLKFFNYCRFVVLNRCQVNSVIYIF